MWNLFNATVCPVLDLPNAKSRNSWRGQLGRMLLQAAANYQVEHMCWKMTMIVRRLKYPLHKG